jgi:GNAT superfamily N-acetyltransferase
VSVEVVIRRAGPADAEAIGEISGRGWAAAYEDLLPADHLARRASSPLSEDWRHYLDAVPGGDVILVAELADRVVGFIRFGSAADQPSEAFDVAEIFGFYVAPERTGQGIGRELFGAALSRLRDRRCRGVVLWTFTGNARAERFYGRAGFKLDGATRPEEETGVEERRWRAEL